MERSERGLEGEGRGEKREMLFSVFTPSKYNYFLRHSVPKNISRTRARTKIHKLKEHLESRGTNRRRDRGKTRGMNRRTTRGTTRGTGIGAGRGTNKGTNRGRVRGTNRGRDGGTMRKSK